MALQPAQFRCADLPPDEVRRTRGCRRTGRESALCPARRDADLSRSAGILGAVLLASAALLAAGSIGMFLLPAVVAGRLPRHAGARTCSVRLVRSDADLCVAIQDDGGGIQQARDDGIGLESMRRRAAEIGGRVSIELARPNGTVVRALLPLRSR